MPKNRSSRPTQRQIAEKLGISPATVSLALRDSPLVAAKTTERVKEAMRESGYIRNIAAASLRTGRSSLVGVSVHNIAHARCGEMLWAIERTLAKAGIVVLFNNHDDCPSNLTDFIGVLATHGADGLIVVPTPFAQPAIFEPITSQGAAIVYLSRYAAGDATADRAVTAAADAARLATAHLIELGHREIVLIGGVPGTSLSDERVAGYHRAMEEAGLPVSEDNWLQVRPRVSDSVAAIRGVLERENRPTGLVCFNDLVGYSAINVARGMNLIPGEDLGIVALGSSAASAQIHPGLTTVQYDPSELGHMAARALIARLETPGAEPNHSELPCKLVLAESSSKKVA